MFVIFLFCHFLLTPLSGARKGYHIISSWGKKGTGKGEFSSPCGIAVDKKGIVYIADKERKKILKFTSMGKFLMEWDTKYPPSAITVDNEGNIYVGESTHKERGVVEKFSEDGKLVNKFTFNGGVTGGIAVSNKFIYLTVISFNGSVHKFTKEGMFVKSWGKLATCCGYLDVAVDSRDNVFVAELGAHRVVKYDSEGKILQKWGKAGKKEGEFCGCCNPIHIAVGPDDAVFTSEKDIPRIQKFSKDGRFITSFGKGQFSEECGYLDIAVSNEGQVFVVDDYLCKVFVFNKK